MHYIYIIENKITGKVYIGQTENPSKRWQAHKKKITNKHLSNSIIKYGIDNFLFNLCECFNSRAEADQAEIFWISEMKFYLGENNVYNANNGGSGNSGYKHTTSRVISEETKRKISQTLTGKKHSENTKLKMAQSRKGLKFSEEAKRKMSFAKKGKKFSKEHIKNISLGHIGQIPWNKGLKNKQKAWNKGNLMKLTDLQLYEIDKLILEGNSITAISKILKISRNVIKREYALFKGNKNE